MKDRFAFRRVLAGVALVVAATSACTTHAGAAAQVGDERIETSTLRGIVDRGMAASRAASVTQGGNGGTPAAVIERSELQRRALGTLVYLNLLEREARQLGVTLGGQDVDAYHQAYGVLQFGGVAVFEERAAAGGIALADLRSVSLSGALELAITDRLTPQLVASDEQARDVYDRITAQFGKIPLTFADARPYLVRWLVADQRTSALQAKLRETAQRSEVSINPRFGNWNVSQFAVVATDSSIATRPAPAPSFGSSPTIQ